MPDHKCVKKTYEHVVSRWGGKSLLLSAAREHCEEGVEVTAHTIPLEQKDHESRFDHFIARIMKQCVILTFTGIDHFKVVGSHKKFTYFLARYMTGAPI